ncbi:cation:proton antiporter domain-containing protein [Methylopila sp. Yamaguchi]|uniref:cation:proton antiporter domain-containing protein n=1 Tax=Methylopila sp. Yamaguchi TaxID=1437817 RepID=UPI000CAB5EC6|nr:cation:proton antiporter [Methylopila sp. Yamaguchi]GBD49482.1 potassium-efflux system protein [Methylopila sp. Yamaguchi]
MPHETPLISTIVAGFVLAFILGAIANRFRLPPLVGYLVAGVLVGPHTPGYVADQQLAPELAEIGVILLMFGVGLHFSLKDLLSVRGVALPGAIAQMAVATALGWALAWLMGWSHGGGLVFGLALSVASTVVLLKALQERRLVESERGKIAVGWLIVEDLAMVLALVLIPAAAGIASGQGGDAMHGDPVALLISRALNVDLGITGVIGVTLLKVALFVALMLVVGRRLIPALLHRIAHTGSRELFRLGVLAIALGVAFGAAKLFGVSLALGAFFAGMILSESELSHRAAQESLPLRDAFAVLFFVSVGMLFDPTIIVRDPWPVVGTLFIIVIGKSVAAFLIVLAFRRSVGTALTISASLAQIGEFSFILAELGVGLNLIPEEGRDLILAGAILSIILNPIVFFAADRIRPRLEARILRPTQTPPFVETPAAETAASEPSAAAPAGVRPVSEEEPTLPDIETEGETQPTTLSGHAVVVGYGRVGAIVVDQLKAANTPFLVIEDSEKRIAELREKGVEVIVGNAANPAVLALANLKGATRLAIAIPDAFEGGQVTEQARVQNPGLLIIGRAHSDAEVDHLAKLGADVVIMGEREIARGMLERIGEPMTKARGDAPGPQEHVAGAAPAAPGSADEASPPTAAEASEPTPSSAEPSDDALSAGSDAVSARTA